jgi:lipopolysaccharide/colanic/teichoic acid biosynthesis glycosyltransferase
MKLSKLTHALRRKRGSLPADLAGLHSVEQLRRILECERSRTDRGGTEFAMLKFAPRDQVTASETLCHLATILKHRLRCTDAAGWLSEQQIGVVLPCTSSQGAWTLANDVCLRFGELAPPRFEVYSYPSDPSQDPGDYDHSPVRQLQAEQPVGALEPMFVQPMAMWKRSVDIFGAAFALGLSAPLLIPVALAIKLTSPGPVFFKQLRAGLGGKPFFIYKFRTMRTGADALKAQLRDQNEVDGPAFKIKNDPRVTSLGRFLRRTSIDELPQLWNVLKGDMSLVGPRPLPCDESAACSGWQKERLSVTPGLTCIWQVKGRSKVTFDEWMRMDLDYVENRSFAQDVKILAATLPAVVLGKGAY